MQLWPKIAKHFGLETGPNLHINLVSIMNTPEKKDIWAKTVKVSFVLLPAVLWVEKGYAAQRSFQKRHSPNPNCLVSLSTAQLTCYVHICEASRQLFYSALHARHPSTSSKKHKKEQRANASACLKHASANEHIQHWNLG